MGKKLTATFVRNIQTPGSYSDMGGMGLRLRVKPDGRKNWIQRLTVSGKVRETGLGSFPVVTLAMARDKAIENKRMVIDGLDPIEERRKTRARLSFADAVDRYIDVKVRELRNEKHQKQWRSTLDTYAVPIIGALPVDSLTVHDVLRVLEPIWTTKTETATRLRQRMEAVLSWATVAGFRTDANPAIWKGNLSELLPKPAKVASKRHHAAVKVADMPEFWQALSARDGMSVMALRFLCLTLARSGEVRGMVWNEVDLDNRLWVIPAERMKAGREHRVPLPDTAVSLLKAVPRVKGCDHVFFSTRNGPLSDMSLSAVMRRIDEKAQETGGKRFLDPRSNRPAVPHGLRSTFRVWAAENGVDHIQAELALAHTVGSEVERAYRRTDMVEQRRALLERWAAFAGG
ncbi:tyrosine-type recombinase/integrase [Celeribacter naphthalenivorans]|uniref:tyrosine-type recombinase/integrase n=1 Tax=Celeribacter naphthalenivorans TaxID=1614694 RepID=UPI001CF94183|nr:site-specific integrase [Celeribacter naphthalenivorans]